MYIQLVCMQSTNIYMQIVSVCVHNLEHKLAEKSHLVRKQLPALSMFEGDCAFLLWKD